MNNIKKLDSMEHLGTFSVMKLASEAEAKLGELKGVVKIIPNENILLNTLPLQEAKASSNIEQIVTTSDELYRSQVDPSMNGTTKEVNAHRDALMVGLQLFMKKQNLITVEVILETQQKLIGNNAGFRTLPDTVLVDDQQNIIYTPPSPLDIRPLMDNLIQFMNDDSFSPLPVLVKMAIMHYQFEKIHPFYDGNGRTGRILNLLYLVKSQRLELPVLYLSRYILANKSEYYRLLQSVRTDNNWESWLLFMLQGVKETAEQTIELIQQIDKLMNQYKRILRQHDDRLYSHDLMNAIFQHPYTKISFIKNNLGCSYKTARTKLERLCELGLLTKHLIGRKNYYLNQQLFDCLTNVHHESS